MNSIQNTAGMSKNQGSKGDLKSIIFAEGT